eukprot:2345804-Pyramimonas_sp.AAC.1
MQKAKDEGDVPAMKAAQAELQSQLMKVGEAMYTQPPPPKNAGGPSGKNKPDDVVDAEFTDSTDDGRGDR